MVSEVQYGGKITDDLDRRMFKTYTQVGVKLRHHQKTQLLDIQTNAEACNPGIQNITTLRYKQVEEEHGACPQRSNTLWCSSLLLLMRCCHAGYLWCPILL